MGVERHLPGVVTSKLSTAVNWARKYSRFQYPVVTVGPWTNTSPTSPGATGSPVPGRTISTITPSSTTMPWREAVS